MKRKQVPSKLSPQKLLLTMLKFYLQRARSNLSFRRSILLKQASMTRKLLLKTSTKQSQSEVSCFRKSKLVSTTQSSLASTMYVHRVTKILQKNTNRQLSKTLIRNLKTTTLKLANLKQSSPNLTRNYLRLLKSNRRLPTRILNYLQETPQSPYSINKLKRCRLKSRAQKLIRQISMKRKPS